MDKEQFELAVMEHLTAVADLYNEFNPNDANHLTITILNYFPQSGWNLDGIWSTRQINCSNTYWELEKEKGINFNISIDIHDDDYYKVNERTDEEPAWKIKHIGYQCKEDFEK